MPPSNRLFVLLIVTVGAFSGITLGDFPEDPKPCPYGNLDCLVKIVNYFIQQKLKGDDKIGLMPLDPLKVDKMTIKQGADSPVNIDLTFTDNEVIGLSTANILKVKGFGKDLTKRHEVYLKFKSVSLVGDYKINGRVLILPISGSGKSNITMSDTEMILSFKGIPIQKDGKTYLGTKDMKVVIKPGRFHYHYGNLFNGDKELGDNMNAFLNENWRDIFNEVENSVASAFGDIFNKVLTGVFAKNPYDTYFVE